LDITQDQKKDSAECKVAFILGKRHGHLPTNSNSEECAHTNGYYQ
jgi:hypothetical protein